jgi:RimJ/RimL family protein N-acetyltransferase
MSPLPPITTIFMPNLLVQGLTGHDQDISASCALQCEPIRWFGREQVPAGVALTFETELGYTFDPAVWGQGLATEAARCVRDYLRDILWLPYAISAILPQNARSRRVAERSGARAAGQMDVVDLTWDRYVWPLATAARLRSKRRPRNTLTIC